MFVTLSHVTYAVRLPLVGGARAGVARICDDITDDIRSIDIDGVGVF